MSIHNLLSQCPYNYIVGEKYRHFVKLQNLIDLSYIQLTTNASIWPLFNLTENPTFIENDPIKTCMNRVMDGSLTDDVWVSTLQYGIVNFVTLNYDYRYRKIEDFRLIF